MGVLDAPEADYEALLRHKADKHKDPKYKLGWLYNKPQDLEISELKGYVPVTESAADTKGGVAAKKLVKVGDLVLGKVPIEQHHARQKALTQRTHLQRSNVRNAHRDEMRKVQRSVGSETELSAGDIQSEVTKL